MLAPISAVLLASALTVNGAATPKVTVAKFDDITTVPGLPTLNPIDKYEGLVYKGFAVNSFGINGTAGLVGVPPQSKPNELVSALPQTLLDGRVGFAVTSSTQFIDLHSFYYGCAVDTVEGFEGVPETCTILVQGYATKASQQAVAQKTTTFHKSSPAKLEKPFKAIFPEAEWKNLKKIRIRQIESTGGGAGTVLILDNIAYTLHT